MKKLLLLFFLLPFFAKGQTNDTAIVQKRQGLPVFIMCEPKQPYKVVAHIRLEDYELDKMITNPGLSKRPPTIEELIAALIHKSEFAGSKKNPITFDAMITNDGFNAALIQFQKSTQ